MSKSKRHVEDRVKNHHCFHVTKAEQGKKLPKGYSRSYAGFLLKDMKREISVNQAIVQQEMEYLSKFGIIACFVGRRAPAYCMSRCSNRKFQVVNL